MIAVLGAFDGFHRGHALLLERAEEMAPSRDDFGVVTFNPHPGLFLGTLKATLFTPEESKLIRLFLGVPRAVELRFDEALAGLSPRLFWNFLRERVPVEGVVVGRDFRFAAGRSGDVPLLESFCREEAIPFCAVDILKHLNAKISSSSVRAHVSAGRCGSAAEELGYPYFIRAEVVHGLERGRSLGFPTANLNVSRTKLLPADGVYSVAVLVQGRWSAGALSIGKNPTFRDVSETRVEVFLLDSEGDLYEESLLVFFLSRLRPQERFESAEQLVRQIGTDVEEAKAAFRRNFEEDPDTRRKLAAFARRESSI
ncbi:MAG: riboflavin biosynthesis protein RibF [Synergistaceae bacterium]|jgi:riboflavin kinase/FMN adenylyltransferase|nr:riboflavin biosynthesis protein RibF [Synergistaceae bacterium]